MIFNYVFEFFCWLAGVIHVLGCIGGLLSLVAIYWLFLSRRGKSIRQMVHLDAEYRCAHCKYQLDCEALSFGITPNFPCPHYCNEKDKPN